MIENKINNNKKATIIILMTLSLVAFLFHFKTNQEVVKIDNTQMMASTDSGYVSISGFNSELQNKDSLKQTVASLYQWGIAIAVILSVIFIIYGALLYMSSTDSITSKSEGSTKITNAIYGLILALSSFLILNTINPELISGKFLKDIDSAQEPKYRSAEGNINILKEQRSGFLAKELVENNIDIKEENINSDLGKDNDLMNEIIDIKNDAGLDFLSLEDFDEEDGIVIIDKKDITPEEYDNLMNRLLTDIEGKEREFLYGGVTDMEEYSKQFEDVIIDGENYGYVVVGPILNEDGTESQTENEKLISKPGSESTFKYDGDVGKYNELTIEDDDDKIILKFR